MKKISLLLLFILNACGQSPHIDQEFIAYLNRFKTEINEDIRTNNVSILFGELTYPIIGRCYRSIYPYSYIVVDKKAWNSMNENGKEELIYHELGHCVLNLAHTDETVKADIFEVPGSIMNSYWFGEAWFYEKYKKQYKQALKNNTLIGI